jgi:DNA-binding NarL/FixJ family response regulator
LSEPDEVKVYLLDRAGDAANAFAAKLQGRDGVYLVGGAGDVEEALDDIGVASPEVILVGTDLGGSGVVAAVERVLAIAPDAAVVALCTAADKALVAQAVRSGAAGSLDRTASPGETITALHVYKRRQRGEAVDMSLAEPPAQTLNLRVSGALPRFPEPEREPTPYQPTRSEPEAEPSEVSPAGGETAAPEAEPTMPSYAAGASSVAPMEPPPPSPSLEPLPPPPSEPPPPPTAPPPSPAADAPPAPGEAEPEPPPPPAADDSDDPVAHLREMLRQEAEAAGGAAAPAKKKRGFLGLFKGKEESKPDWGPKKDGKEGKGKS